MPRILPLLFLCAAAQLKAGPIQPKTTRHTLSLHIPAEGPATLP